MVGMKASDLGPKKEFKKVDSVQRNRVVHEHISSELHKLEWKQNGYG